MRAVLATTETMQGDVDEAVMGGHHFGQLMSASTIAWSNTVMRAAVRGGEWTAIPMPHGLILNKVGVPL
jgi:hypothetical protein